MIYYNKLSLAAKELGLVPKVPVDIKELADESKRKHWVEEKNMIVFSLIHPDDNFTVIDIMIQDYIDFDSAYECREYINEMGLKVSTVSIEDLIKLKEIANRSRDQADIEALKKIKDLSNGKE